MLERWTGPAFVYAEGKTATDDVVFGLPGDLVLLGARSLEGLNLRIDPVSKRLVDAGPAPVAPVLAGLIARFVVIRMHPVEEEQRGHAQPGKIVMV